MKKIINCLTLVKIFNFRTSNDVSVLITKHCHHWNRVFNEGNLIRSILVGLLVIEMLKKIFNYISSAARSNNHRFPTPIEEESALIYNYRPYYTLPDGSEFTQVYFF